MVDLTIRELARITRRHTETLRRLARNGKLPGASRHQRGSRAGGCEIMSEPTVSDRAHNESGVWSRVKRLLKNKK